MKVYNYKNWHLHIGQERRKNMETWFSISPVGTKVKPQGFTIFGPNKGIALYYHNVQKESN